MAKFGYEGPSEFEPLSAWGYFGYTILFSIPLIGFIALLVCAFSSVNINRRSFARSYFCGLILLIIICVIIIAAAGGISAVTSIIDSL